MVKDNGGTRIATRNLKKMGYRCVDVSNDSRHKGYNVLGWRNGQVRKIGIESRCGKHDAAPKFSRVKKSACDMLVISDLRTGLIEIKSE